MLNMTSALDRTEGAYKPLVELASTMFTGGSNDLKLRRMVVLRATKVLGGPDDMQACVAVSRDHGLSPEEIEATVGDGPVTGAPPDCALICAVVDELLEVGTLTHVTLRRMQGRFGLITICKLVSIVGWSAAVGLHFENCRVPLRKRGYNRVMSSLHD